MSSLREPFNALSHAIGFILAVAGLIGLQFCVREPSKRVITFVYGLSLTGLYLTSAVYHSFTGSSKVLTTLRKLDRFSISLLIAGTTTPVAIWGLQWPSNVILVVLVWACVVPVLAMSLLSVQSDWVHTSTYLAQGWVGILFAGKLLNKLGLQMFFFLLAGGIIYTLGAFIYLFDQRDYFTGIIDGHSVWHVMTILGSLSHYYVIFELSIRA